MMFMRQFAIALGIAVLYPMIVYYGVNAFHAFPELHQRTFVSARIAATTEEERKSREREDQAEEQRQKEQKDAIDQATRPFWRILILVAAPLGVLAIVAGSYVKIPSIGTGLILGGMSTVVEGYSGYWDYLEGWVRLLSLLAGLCILFFIGYRQYFVARNTAT